MKLKIDNIKWVKAYYPRANRAPDVFTTVQESEAISLDLHQIQDINKYFYLTYEMTIVFQMEVDP